MFKKSKPSYFLSTTETSLNADLSIYFIELTYSNFIKFYKYWQLVEIESSDIAFLRNDKWVKLINVDVYKLEV